MKKLFSFVIAGDHTILREGLKSLLSSHPDLKVVGEAADGLEAILCAQIHSPVCPLAFLLECVAAPTVIWRHSNPALNLLVSLRLRHSEQ